MTARPTPLHAEHEALGARFTEFCGWSMPLRYGSDLDEHRAVREAVGMFDLSHMGEVRVRGPQAAAFLNHALVGDFAAIEPGRAKYSVIVTPTGGIIDDLIGYRLAEDEYLLVPNAGNVDAVLAALRERAAGFDVELADETLETALIAVQGPKAVEVVAAVVGDAAGHGSGHTASGAARPESTDTDAPAAAGHGFSHAANGAGRPEPTDVESPAAVVRGLGRYRAVTIPIAGVEVLLARTGYTGEDGFELYLPSNRAVEVWRALLAAGADHGILPAGLSARDSLRLEAGMPLYCNDLGIDITPFEAGLGGIVPRRKADDYVGREALERIRESGPDRILVGLRGTGRRAARAGYPVHLPGGDEVGEVTSGLPSPTLGVPIALARIRPDAAEPGTALEVDLRGKREPFEVVETPFLPRD